MCFTLFSMVITDIVYLYYIKEILLLKTRIAHGVACLQGLLVFFSFQPVLHEW